MILNSIVGLWVVYLVIHLIRYGIPFSISASVYSWEEDNKQAWTDRLFLVLLLIYTGIGYIILNPYPLGFVAGALISAIGISYDFRASKEIRFIHNFCSFIGIPLATLVPWVYFGEWFYFAWFMSVGVLSFLLRFKNYVFYVEVLALIIVSIWLYE